MKIQLVSDMHMSATRNILEVNDQADILIFAGDIFSRPQLATEYFRILRTASDIPIIYVLGNHEYYSNVFPKDINLYRKAVEKIADCHILEKELFHFQGINFFGTTLWSDLSDPVTSYVVMRGLNDYQYIRDAKGHVLSPQTTNEEHKAATAWLAGVLTEHKDETNVVVTHHAPLWECRAREFDYQSDSQYIAAGFCSRMDTFISQHEIKLWLHGHTHRSGRKSKSHTTVIANCMGFAHEVEVCKYQPSLLIEV